MKRGKQQTWKGDMRESSASPPIASRQTHRFTNVDQWKGGKGFVFSLVTVYLFLDLVRPSFVWHFPKVISTILLVAWIVKPNKIWPPPTAWFFVFLGVMGIDILIAKNTFDAVWFTYGMTVMLVGICIPLINFTDSLQKLRHIVNALLAIFLYIAVFALMNQGFGPAGGKGGQDENYVAAAMNLAIPLAGFSFFAERAKWKKVCFAVLVALYLGAIVIGLSRGGFVGLLCGLGYSFVKTPRKGVAILSVVFVACFLLVIAGPTYWEEMRTITDTSEGTADMRLELWKIAVEEFLAYPLTGVGGGNYRWLMNEFESPEQLEKYGRILVAEVHSTYFELLAELGLAGCIAFGFVLFHTYRNYKNVERISSQYFLALRSEQGSRAEEDLRWIQAYGRGLMGGYIAYLASIAFLSSLYYSHTWIPAAIMAALYLIAVERVKQQDCQACQVENRK